MSEVEEMVNLLGEVKKFSGKISEKVGVEKEIIEELFDDLIKHIREFESIDSSISSSGIRIRVYHDGDYPHIEVFKEIAEFVDYGDKIDEVFMDEL